MKADYLQDYFQNELRRRGRKQDDQSRAVKARLASLKPTRHSSMTVLFETIMRSTNDFVRRKLKNPKDFKGISFWG